ncbi:hypothetical protein [Candidatus Leptofilum sp.]|uniref:hypothetical protein n=1 Tax=Candidatus Leptofilum sp. TaxID=3241576 RepID=UPI003B59BD8C
MTTQEEMQAKEYLDYEPIDQAQNIANKERIVAIMEQMLNAPLAEMDDAIRASYHAASPTPSTNWAMPTPLGNSFGSRCVTPCLMLNAAQIFWRAAFIVGNIWWAVWGIMWVRSRTIGWVFRRRAGLWRCAMPRGICCVRGRLPRVISLLIFWT